MTDEAVWLAGSERERLPVGGWEGAAGGRALEVLLRSHCTRLFSFLFGSITRDAFHVAKWP